MTKRELVVRISKETGIIQEDIQVILQKFLDYVSDALVKGDTVEFRDFGVFQVCVRKARTGRNPKKPLDTVVIPDRKVVRFKSGKLLKERVLLS